METASIPSVVSLGLKPSSQLEQCKNFVSTSYTVDVGQGLFSKPLKPESLDSSLESVKLDDSSEFDYDIEYAAGDGDDIADNVPLGEILDRLQTEPDKFEAGGDKSNLIRLHAAGDCSDGVGGGPAGATISATLNFATLDLSQPSSLQSQLSEINDVLLSISSRPEPLAISTSSQLSTMAISSPLSSPPVINVASPVSASYTSPPSSASVPESSSLFSVSSPSDDSEQEQSVKTVSGLLLSPSQLSAECKASQVSTH